MSEAAATPDENASAEEAGGKSNKLMTILVLVLGPILLTAGILAGLYFSGFGEKIFSQGAHGGAPKAQEEGSGPPPAEVSYLEIKELLVNLTKSFKKSRNIPFLRLSLKLELPNEEASKKAEALRPRIIDSFQVYLRQLRTEDLEGGAGIQRLREELLKRANDVLRPIKVSNILFEQMLVQ
jgi:flagellar protein FliL